MKRKVGITSILAALGVVLILGTGAARAQQPASSGGTRIAVINMYVISKEYERNKMFSKELKAMAEPYEAKIKEWQKGYEAWRKALQNADTPKKTEEAQKNVTAFKRAIEDKSIEVSKKFKEKIDRYVVSMYREIEDAVSRYAKANGIHLVMYYYEKNDEMYSSPNIQTKLKAASINDRAMNPIYMADGVDISQQVLHILNGRYRAAATAPNTKEH